MWPYGRDFIFTVAFWVHRVHAGCHTELVHVHVRIHKGVLLAWNVWIERVRKKMAEDVHCTCNSRKSRVWAQYEESWAVAYSICRSCSAQSEPFLWRVLILLTTAHTCTFAWLVFFLARLYTSVRCLHLQYLSVREGTFSGIAGQEHQIIPQQHAHVLDTNTNRCTKSLMPRHWRPGHKLYLYKEFNLAVRWSICWSAKVISPPNFPAILFCFKDICALAHSPHIATSVYNFVIMCTCVWQGYGCSVCTHGGHFSMHVYTF